jgi:hypothetical protein
MTADERRQSLLAVFEQLDAGRQDRLIGFAVSLVAGDEAAAMRPEPRPAEESVVAAIKRLTRSYPAAGRRRLMGPVSALLAQHALQGRGAAEVIDELEAVFERHHREAVNGK